MPAVLTRQLSQVPEMPEISEVFEHAHMHEVLIVPPRQYPMDGVDDNNEAAPDRPSIDAAATQDIAAILNGGLSLEAQNSDVQATHDVDQHIVEAKRPQLLATDLKGEGMERSPPPSYTHSLSQSQKSSSSSSTTAENNKNNNNNKDAIVQNAGRQEEEEEEAATTAAAIVGGGAGAAVVQQASILQASPTNSMIEENEAQVTIPSNVFMHMDSRIAKAETNATLEEVLERYEIGDEFAKKLEFLRDYKIVFILDDSSSMKHLLEDSPLLKIQPRVARWNELQYFANIALQLANFYDKEGCDLHFLNKQPGLKNCRSLVDLNSFFKQTKPKGFTPLTSTLQSVLNEYQDLVNSGRKLLTIIVTDGEPTDMKGNSDVKGFRKCLMSRAPNVYTNIVACTDQEDTMRYLNRLDRRLKQIDVLDDYRSEKEEVRKARGRRYQFTYGDYVVKALIGSIDKKTDVTDEQRGVRRVCRVS